MKAAIICNGLMKEFKKEWLKGVDLIIAADGGSNHCKKYKITPHYIVGDMDSVTENVLLGFLKKVKTIVIKDTDQNKTDLQLAIELAKEHKATEYVILGAISTRIDHTIANLYCLDRIKKGKIIDEKNEVFFVRKSIELKGKKGQTVSVIALSDVKGLTYEGLKWGVKNRDVKNRWSGICNVMLKNKAKVSLKKGKILVMKTRD